MPDRCLFFCVKIFIVVFPLPRRHFSSFFFLSIIIQATFEYSLTRTATELITPPFSTDNIIFWQLEYRSKCELNTNFFAIKLHAIANEQEVKSEDAWKERQKFHAVLYIVNNHEDKPKKCVAKLPLDLTSLSQNSKSKDFVFRRENLGDKFSIGVSFSGIIHSTKPVAEPFPNYQLSEGLLRGWAAAVNRPDTSDVLFEVSGENVYAHSFILSARSEYFHSFFQRNWAECLPSPSVNNSNLQGRRDDNLKNIKYTIKVPDFNPKTFIEMLRFLYTNEVTFADDDDTDSPTSPIAMMTISDKYLIDELRGRVKTKIYKTLTVENAAKTLFKVASKWLDVEEMVLDFVVKNFGAIRKTKGFLEYGDGSEVGHGSEVRSILLELLKRVPLQ